MIAVWHIMPAIRVGCTVVIKPSPFTPLWTLCLVAPFGGVKNSSIGVEFNVAGLREYTTVQVLNVAL